VLYGGRSGEHEISLQSAASVIHALDKKKYEVLPIGINKEGRWLAGTAPSEVISRGFRDDLIPVCLPADPTYKGLIALERERDGKALNLGKKIDVVFPVLHGPFGEDGTVQGLLELAGIPYIGGGVLGSSLGMDKILMKTVFAQHNFPQADYLGFLKSDWLDEQQKISKRVEGQIGYPCFIKPANLGSSVGISKAGSQKEFIQGVNLAFEYDRKVVIEENIVGREIEVSVLGNDQPKASLPGEIIPCNEFYDYEAKYLAQGSQLIIPAVLAEEKILEFQKLAVAVFKAIDCAGMARVDFFLRDNGQVLVNEINTIPGFTQISMYPKLWEATGLKYQALLDKLIQFAINRHQR
ncbi:MAG: D-alanine--D-alanine ligase family protein, partial [Bacillota bacterium]